MTRTLVNADAGYLVQLGEGLADVGSPETAFTYSIANGGGFLTKAIDR